MVRRILFPMLMALAMLVLTSVVLVHSSVRAGGKECSGSDCPPRVPVAAGTCADPINVNPGGQFTGNTAGHANNHDVYSCSAWLESGPEVIYSVNVVTPVLPGNITAEISELPPGVDLDVFILAPGGCVAGVCADSGSYGDVSATAGGLGEGTYYIAVDGFTGDEGSYVLNVGLTGGPSLAYTPSNPAPIDGAFEVSPVGTVLSWDGGHPSGDLAEVYYYVYIREEGEATGSQAPCSPVLEAGDVSRLSCSSPGVLKPNTRYSWWVIVESFGPGGYGLVSGPFWEFSTAPGTYLPLVLRGSP